MFINGVLDKIYRSLKTKSDPARAEASPSRDDADQSAG
jgi:hypothetical protein